jgi:DNA topoisomerase-1
MHLAAPDKAARQVGLHYVSDSDVGIRRRKSGRGFVYTKNGRSIHDPATLDRIAKLAAPPAWTDVWICAEENGHLQATGRDARGRKQHRYHARFRESREAAKFDGLVEFGKTLPKVRAAIARDRRRQGLPRAKVLATIAHLLDITLIRVGNDDYAKSNDSYGLTTLRDKHATIKGAELKLIFTGKSGKQWRLSLKDKRIAAVVKATQDLPGQRLFQYVDDEGEVCPVSSTDVNAYLREVSGRDISAKDFRTWSGTVLAATELAGLESAETQGVAKARIKAAIANVARRLGNTPTICRKCYVHPALVEAYADRGLALPRSRRAGLSSKEASTLAFLERLESGAKKRSRTTAPAARRSA